MIFDFQREMPSGRWADLGISRLPNDVFDVDLAFRSLKAEQGGSVPAGRYRFRIIGGEERWRYGDVDRGGRFSSERD